MQQLEPPLLAALRNRAAIAARRRLSFHCPLCNKHVRSVMEPILQDLKRRKTAEAVELAKKAGLLPQDFDIEQYRKLAAAAAKYAKPSESGAPETPQ